MDSRALTEPNNEKPESDLAIWPLVFPYLRPELVFLFSMVNHAYRKECDQAKYWSPIARDYFPREFQIIERRHRLGVPEKAPTWKQRYAERLNHFYNGELTIEEKFQFLIQEGDVAGIEENIKPTDFDDGVFDNELDTFVIGRSQAMRNYAFKLFLLQLDAQEKDEFFDIDQLFIGLLFNQSDQMDSLKQFNLATLTLWNEKYFRDWFDYFLLAAKGGHNLALDTLQSLAASVNDQELEFAKVVALYEAIRYGRVEVVKQLLTFGLPVDGLRNLSLALLTFLEHQANDIEACVWDALRNCNVDGACVQNIGILHQMIPSPLIMATILGDISIMKVLLDKGANPNLVYKQHNSEKSPLIELQKTALHFAIAEEDIDAVQLLLSHGARVDKYDVVAHSSLLFALQKQNKPIINAILRTWVNADLSSFSPEPLLAEAIRLNDDSIINALLSLQVNLHHPLMRPDQLGGVHFDLVAPLSLAAEDKNRALVLALLNKGADVRGLNPTIACYKEKQAFFKSLIQILIDHRYDADILNHMLYVVALIGDDALAARLIEVLLAEGRLDVRHLPLAITHADSNQHAGVVVLLINALCLCREVEVNTLNEALYVCVRRGNSELVKRLIHCGANPNFEHYPYYDAKNLIDLARDNRHTAIVELLLDAVNEELIKYIDEHTKARESAKKSCAVFSRFFSNEASEDKKLNAAKLLLALRKGEVSKNALAPYKAELEKGWLGDIYRRYTAQDLKQAERQEVCRRRNGF